MKQRGWSVLRKALVEARKALGLTQKRIAESVGVSRSFYGLIETGARNPRYWLAKKIAKKVRRSISNIFFDYHSFKMKRNNER